MDPPVKIIGVAGPARSGKDTVGDYLLGSRHGYQSYSFAQPMKDMICIMLGKSEDWINEHKEEMMENIGASPRKMLQTLGTDWGRDMIHKDIWMMLGLIFINNCRSSGIDGVVITDVRFDNEAEMIRKSGGVICHINRPGGPEVRDHASELGIIHQATDFHIVNDGTIDDLHQEVEHLMEVYDRLIKLRR